MTPAEILVKTVLEAWGESDLGPAREALHDDVVWKSASTLQGGAYRFGGIYNGKAEVIELLSLISMRYYFRRYDPKEIISKGEIVWGLFDVTGTYMANSVAERKPFAFEAAFRFRIRDGKILEVQSFFDTMALLAQQGEIGKLNPKVA